MYEPLWDDLYKSLHKKSISIRSIWIADVAAQGYSSGLNDGKLGNDSKLYVLQYIHINSIPILISLRVNRCIETNTVQLTGQTTPGIY